MKKLFSAFLIAFALFLGGIAGASMSSDPFDSLLDSLVNEKIKVKILEAQVEQKQLAEELAGGLLGFSGNLASLSTPTTTQATGAASGSLFIGSVLPSINNQFDLGSPGFSWRDAYIDGALTVGSCTGCGGGGGASADWNLVTGGLFIAPSTSVGIAVATSTANPVGLFNVDTLGNINSSGTLFNMRALNAIVSSTHGRFGGNVNVTGSLFLNTGSVIDFGEGDVRITHSANALTITDRTTFNAAWIIPDNITAFFGTGSDFALLYCTNNTPDAGCIGSPEVDSDVVYFLENADRSTAISFPFQTDPAFIFVSNNAVAGDRRLFVHQQSPASSTIWGVQTPVLLKSGSSTFKFANTDPGYNTTTLMVTSTAPGGVSSITLENTAGNCVEIFVVGTTLTVDPCGKWVGGATSTFP